MTREEAVTVLKGLMKNPLFSEVHKVAFNIAIHDIKQRHDWDINNLILINKENYEQQTFKWCTDCKEYDQEKHCCHRYSKVIRDAVAQTRQEPVLDKINKMKSEIADSLEFWDYSPNNNPLARDMLETLTNFWGDIKTESEG